mgnify:CR=1 FL=1
MLLDVKNIDVLYDDFQVIWDISINVNKAEMVALLGPNGSGKSTILNTISNLVQHRNGSIHFENNLISEIPTHKRTELGNLMYLKEEGFFPI